MIFISEKKWLFPGTSRIIGLVTLLFSGSLFFTIHPATAFSNGQIIQGEETMKLLARPLTVSTQPKTWTETPMRGINMGLISPQGSSNSVNPGSYLTDADFQKFQTWNVNLLRLVIDVDQGSPWDIPKGKMLPPIPADNPMAPYQKHLEALKVALHLAEKYHIYIIVNAGNVAGRNIDVLYNKSDGSGYQQTLIDLWRHIAREFGSHPQLLGYDLLNEPHSANELQMWQQETMPALVKVIRTYDRNTYLVVEPGPWGLPEGFKDLKPVNDPKVVYSFHFYYPHNYTHQGIQARPLGLVYPGMLKCFDSTPEILWNREQLKASMTVARKFQQDNHVRIFVGEFSAVRWAPGAAQWLKDAISVFEEYGWDWCYHSYTGWNGWNPTFDADAPSNNNPDGGKNTDRLKALIAAWEKNKH